MRKNSLPSPGPHFLRKKAEILSQLSVPDDEYTDASPKGSVDAGIRDLVDEINSRHDGLVTTSSCAGRVSVYLEGRKGAGKRRKGSAGIAFDEEELGRSEGRPPGGDGGGGTSSSAAGGKGGGKWLFVSHDPVRVPAPEDAAAFLGLGSHTGDEGLGSGLGGALGSSDGEPRLIHFKFEPMILHILAASLEHAQLAIQAGLEAGFREAGAVALLSGKDGEAATPVVAVRSMGLSLESLIGVEHAEGRRACIVSSEYLAMLVRISNRRFEENRKRITRFRQALQASGGGDAAPSGASSKANKPGWEDVETRRQRKREEGLRRREELIKVADAKTRGKEQQAQGGSGLDQIL